MRDQVLHALAADPVLDISGISIEMIDDDAVALRGAVGGSTTALRIEELAAGTPGIRRVDNQLTVRGGR